MIPYKNLLKTLFIAVLFVICLSINLCVGVTASTEDPSIQNADSEPGDRISSSAAEISDLTAVTLSKDEYHLAYGDTLAVDVQGRAQIVYKANLDTDPGSDPRLVTISSNGDVFLPLIGRLDVAGKTVTQFETEVKTKLARYFKHFTINISLVKPRVMFITVTGQVKSSGVLSLPATATASMGVMKAGIESKGSVRRVELIHNGSTQVIDLYRILVLGDIDTDIELHPGDTIYVPAISRYVTVTGQAIRGGKFEMVTSAGETGDFRIKDLLQLAIGTTPEAMSGKAFVERINASGGKTAIHVDLQSPTSPDFDLELQPGDNLVIPSVSAYQSMIRMIGEFKGDGVYQRIVGTSSTNVENKSGIYFLKQGQTVADVIRATGGVTPQASLKHAYIRRQDKEGQQDIPVDLEQLLVKEDKTADMMLRNGDYLILPAVEDKIHVFGEVKSPGSYGYSPSRRLLDYISAAGGHTNKSKLNDVRLLRGTSESPAIIKVNISNAVKGKSLTDNPVLEAGDIVYIPSKAIGGWQDAIQLAFTTLSLNSLLRGL